MRAEALASDADVESDIGIDHTLPATINDKASAARVAAALQRLLGEGRVIDPGMSAGSEDVSWFARDAGVPLVFWFWGGSDPVRWAEAEVKGAIDRDIAVNHSSSFALVIHPTIEVGVTALVAAAREFLR